MRNNYILNCNLFWSIQACSMNRDWRILTNNKFNKINKTKKLSTHLFCFLNIGNTAFSVIQYPQSNQIPTNFYFWLVLIYFLDFSLFTTYSIWFLHSWSYFFKIEIKVSLYVYGLQIESFVMNCNSNRKPVGMLKTTHFTLLVFLQWPYPYTVQLWSFYYRYYIL